MQIPWMPVTSNLQSGSLMPPPFVDLLRNWSRMSEMMCDVMKPWQGNSSPQPAIAGDPGIESEVSAAVASYGKQLGIIEEAVMELAEGLPRGPKLQRLAQLMAAIELVKEDQQQNSVQGQLRQLLKSMQDEKEKAATAASH